MRSAAPASVVLTSALALLLAGCGSLCTVAPAPPALPDVPSDWSQTVRANCLDNVQRLARWEGGQTMLGPSDSPAKFFIPVGPASIGTDPSTPVDVRVIVHGWAPGYLQAVTAAGGDIVWWGPNAAVGGVWTSNWAWIPTVVSGFQVSSTGLFQQTQAQSSDAIVLGFSWIDDSATQSISDFIHLTEVYQSEAYTNIAGVRLANALDQVLAPGFWTNPANRLHLIGHSHGSKVATVAALTLQMRHGGDAKKGADHLTTLDSPESEITLEGSGANLIGFYVQDLAVAADPVDPAPGSIFVDNLVSYFGTAYRGNDAGSPLNRVVNVMLYPWLLSASPGAAHSYSAEWYAGAVPGAAAAGLLPIGLAWPPVPASYQPTSAAPYLNEDWFRSRQKTQAQQWGLYLSDASNAARAVFRFGTQATSISDRGDHVGNVTFTGGKLTLIAASGSSGPTLARFHGAYDNPLDSDDYGLGFTLSWTHPTDGDYLVVTVSSSDVTEGQETILVLDGRSLAGAPTPDLDSVPVSFNSSVSNGVLEDVQFYVYFIPAAGNTQGEITLEDFVLISSTSINGLAEGPLPAP